MGAIEGNFAGYRIADGAIERGGMTNGGRDGRGDRDIGTSCITEEEEGRGSSMSISV